jgi:hypothetical protein
MITKEQIGVLTTELGVLFHPDMGGREPSVEQMADLIKIGKAARYLETEINSISSHIPYEDYEAADELAKKSEPNPFRASVPEVLAPSV